MSDTPRVHVLIAKNFAENVSISEALERFVKLASELERRLSDSVQAQRTIAELASQHLRDLAIACDERDEARYHADSDVCGALDCGSTFPGKDGWRKDCECDEYELRYAAKRGFIERHPERPTWFKFTKAGEELIS